MPIQNFLEYCLLIRRILNTMNIDITTSLSKALPQIFLYSSSLNSIHFIPAKIPWVVDLGIKEFTFYEEEDHVDRENM